MNLKGYKSIQNSRISDDMDEQNSVDREVELLQDLYSDYTDDLEEMRSNYANGREDTATVEDWEQAYRALIDEIRGLDIENPQEVYDTLVDWNWHRLTWCMCLAGKLGQGELNEAVKWLGKYAYDDKSYLALKNIANSDFGGSKVGDSRKVSDERRNPNLYHLSLAEETLSAEEFRSIKLIWDTLENYDYDFSFTLFEGKGVFDILVLPTNYDVQIMCYGDTVSVTSFAGGRYSLDISGFEGDKFTINEIINMIGNYDFEKWLG